MCAAVYKPQISWIIAIFVSDFLPVSFTNYNWQLELNQKRKSIWLLIRSLRNREYLFVKWLPKVIYGETAAKLELLNQDYWLQL